MVGSAPSREGDEPVFQILSETDVRNVRDGFVTRGDLRENLAAAVESDIGK